jgi:chromosome partitioning protein
MKQTITICQRKGGVAKSTAVLNLACVFAFAGHRVLIIDLDDQANTSSSISGHIQSEKTIADLLLKDEVSACDVMVQTGWENVKIIPASENLSGALKYLDSEVGGHLMLKEKLADAEYDICLIDNSPSLNILNIASFCASTHLFIPLSSKYFSLQGLGQTLSAYNKVQKRLNPDLKLLGMAFVIHDSRSTLANEIVQRVRIQYPGLLFNTIVGTNIRIEEAQVKKQSILTYSPEDRGAHQYRELGREILDRLKAAEPVESEATYG